jgi:hypothetical protein
MDEKNVFLILTHYDNENIISEWYEKNKDTGVGNMLFQIASALIYAKNNNARLYVPPLSIYFKAEELNQEDTIFRNINANFNDNYKNENIFNLQNYIYINLNGLPFKNNIVLSGYFENYLNFNNDRDFILQTFGPNEKDKEYILNKYPFIYDEDVCSIHIRGGQKYFEIYFPEYFLFENYKSAYVNCINYMIENKKIKKLIVLTNDKKFAKTIVEIFSNRIQIYYSDELPFIDIWIISLIKKNITSQSTLSWWGSYLNNHSDKFILSSLLFKRPFFLPDWIIIS